MEKSGNCNEFDQFYTDLCNGLRKMAKASSFCQLIKNAKTDLHRIAILNKECNFVPNLIKTVKRCKRSNSKDPEQARKTLEVYYSKKANFSESDNLIRLLNSALSYVEIEDQEHLQQFDDFGRDEIVFLENLLVDCAKTSVSDETLLISDVYRQRADHFYDMGDYKMSIIESLRAIRYAKFNKNIQNDHLFLLLFRICSSLKQLNQWKMSTNVIQFSLKFLRSSALDNTAKSIETMKLVKLLKQIQTLSKNGADCLETTLNFQCLSESKQEILPKIFDSTSDILVNASSSLQLEWHADRGRHLIATKTIPPGSTIIIERPYSWTVHPHESLSFCQNCCQEVKNLILCNKCSAVVFCSEQCQKASEDYHQYECEFMKSLTSSEILGDMALLCYRTITKTDFNVLESHAREYFSLQKDREENPDSEFPYFHEKFILGLDEQRKLDSSSYTSVFAQTPNDDDRLGGDLLKRSFSAILLTICLRLTGYFKSGEIDSESNLNETEELIASLLLRHLQSASCNAYEINKTSGQDPRRLQVDEIGGATYPIISTTNHSCNSNVYRFTIGKTCIVKTLREIHCGEEILDSYGPHFASNLVEERSRLLNGQYLFTCCCSACSENWLIFSQLPKENPCFRCTICETGLWTKKKDKYICSECNNVFDVKKSAKTVIDLQKQFQAAKELVLSSKDGSKIDYETAEISIIQYAYLLARTQQWPCQVLIECQETLKLCWNLQNRT